MAAGSEVRQLAVKAAAIIQAEPDTHIQHDRIAEIVGQVIADAGVVNAKRRGIAARILTELTEYCGFWRYASVWVTLPRRSSDWMNHGKGDFVVFWTLHFFGPQKLDALNALYLVCSASPKSLPDGFKDALNSLMTSKWIGVDEGDDLIALTECGEMLVKLSLATEVDPQLITQVVRLRHSLGFRYGRDTQDWFRNLGVGDWKSKGPGKPSQLTWADHAVQDIVVEEAGGQARYSGTSLLHRLPLDSAAQLVLGKIVALLVQYGSWAIRKEELLREMYGGGWGMSVWTPSEFVEAVIGYLIKTGLIVCYSHKVTGQEWFCLAHCQLHETLIDQLDLVRS
ncbi:hypothetical protein HGA91_01875 [candidate division WWE3 bacterium]|nr:hypothetical protein [candidate division WWE3 bacterium]